MTRCDKWCGTTKIPAVLCSSCGFGNKRDNCCVCGKWTGSTQIPAVIGNCHGFGNKRDNCVLCDKWCGSIKTPAVLCNQCGFGNKRDNCAKNVDNCASKTLNASSLEQNSIKGKAEILFAVRNYRFPAKSDEGKDEQGPSEQQITL